MYVFLRFSQSTTLNRRSLSLDKSLITTSKNINQLLQIHATVIRHGLESHQIINFKLQRSYSALGRLDYSVSLFNRIQNPNVFLYTNIIHSHIINNLQKTGLHFYVQMLTDGVEPNEFTLSTVLKACSIEDGKSVHCQAIKLGFDSYSYVRTALVDNYSKGGDVVSARHLFDTMTDWSLVSVTSMITGYAKNGDLENARLLFDGTAEKDVVCWNVMIDGYAHHGRSSEALSLFREMLASKMRANEKTLVVVLSACGVQKEPGCTSIEVNNKVHEFVAGDCKHPKSKEIYMMLEEVKGWLKAHSYTPQTDVVLHDIGESEKERSLEVHSEKLSIAFGLISTQPRTTITIVKNLRVCSDCHAVTKLISKFTGCEIVVRDMNQFHHFVNGSCSCGDYW